MKGVLPIDQKGCLVKCSLNIFSLLVKNLYSVIDAIKLRIVIRYRFDAQPIP